MAWSGGLDSTVLMHLLAQARGRAGQVNLRGLHVDHGLQPAAADFRRFCRSTARSWQVPLQVIRAEVQLGGGVSVEEAARKARYAALAAALRPGELLLTAQHADDQFETLMLALMRGAGPAGLAAMPAAAAFGSTLLLRPLLEQDRAQLATYASRHALPWQEDPSNALLRFDRNFLRARVIPALRERWPAAAGTAGRSARHCAVAAALVDDVAQRDLATAVDGPDLEIVALRRLSLPRQAGVLRRWIGARGFKAPDARHLRQIALMMDARIDAHPELRLPGYVVRRHAGRLLLEAPAPSRAPAPATRRWSWQQGALLLEGGKLEIVADRHGDIDLARLPRWLLVQHPSAPGGRSLRKLMQELAIPEWQRERLPVVFAVRQSGAPLAIADLWLAGKLRTTADSASRGRIFWRELR